MNDVAAYVQDALALTFPLLQGYAQTLSYGLGLGIAEPYQAVDLQGTKHNSYLGTGSPLGSNLKQGD